MAPLQTFPSESKKNASKLLTFGSSFDSYKHSIWQISIPYSCSVLYSRRYNSPTIWILNSYYINPILLDWFGVYSMMVVRLNFRYNSHLYHFYFLFNFFKGGLTNIASLSGWLWPSLNFPYFSPFKVGIFHYGMFICGKIAKNWQLSRWLYVQLSLPRNWGVIHKLLWWLMKADFLEIFYHRPIYLHLSQFCYFYLPSFRNRFTGIWLSGNVNFN